MKQLSLELTPQEPYSLYYFVPHSGVVRAHAVLENAVNQLACNPSTFHVVYLWGPTGSGKKHLMQGFRARAVNLAVPRDKVYCVCAEDLDKVGQAPRVGEFVSRFEQLKTDGGLLIVIAENAPVEVSQNPHLVSRLCCGSVLELNFAAEDELQTLLQSLLERRNLRLSSRSLEYLLRRLPQQPLSFDNIFAKISELSFLKGKPAGFSVVREAVEECKRSCKR